MREGISLVNQASNKSSIISLEYVLIIYNVFYVRWGCKEYSIKDRDICFTIKYTLKKMI